MRNIVYPSQSFSDVENELVERYFGLPFISSLKELLKKLFCIAVCQETYDFKFSVEVTASHLSMTCVQICGKSLCGKGLLTLTLRMESHSLLRAFPSHFSF